ncbi:Non-specific serine/threonine protein kinase [Bertholletia excelsa]
MCDGGGGAPSLELTSLKVISALGRGAKGVVFLVQTESSDDEFNHFIALKVISRASIEKDKRNNNNDGSEYRRICFEQEVLRSLQHPLFPRLRGTTATDKIVGYAIDYCPGRDLNSLRKRQTEKMFSDDLIRFYAAELVLALEYLHGMGIVYRDLKPENVMIQENGHLMLVDFDLSTKLPAKPPENRQIVRSVPKPEQIVQSVANEKKKKRQFLSYRWCNSGILPEGSATPPELSSISKSSPPESESDSVEKSNSFVGTEEYVAPEIILGKGHDFAVDWWCLGIMLYEMLYGKTPFRGLNRKETFYNILHRPPDLVGEQTALRDLIGKLLEKNLKQRIALEGIKGHDFFEGVDWNLVMQVHRPPYIPVQPEDTMGNSGIDVESFVEGIFKTGNEDKVEARKDSQTQKNDEESKINGAWAEGLNLSSQTDNFVIF